MTRFRILGPLEASRGGGTVALGGHQQRAVLAMLLLNANRVVPIPQIVDGLWSGRVPDRALNTVQVYVSALRRALGSAEDGEPLVTTHGRGYRLRVDDGELDLLEFLAAAADGRRLMDRHRHAEASERFHHALALWRGPALDEFAEEPFAQAELAALEESRLAALEARIEADLALGRRSDVIAELCTLIARHPLRERFRGLHMEALYRHGRQADALVAFQQARTVLAEELGIDPGPELRALHLAILHQRELDPVPGPGVGSNRPFLLLHDGGGSQQVVPLDAARSPLTIGRRSANDICLGWDQEVSRFHATLHHDVDGWTLVDDGQSRNGSFVDGERVHDRHRLRDAQVVRLGGTVLVFRTTGAPAASARAGSGVTSDAPVASAARLDPEERRLLESLAAGGPTSEVELMALHRRFGVLGLPAEERDEAMLRRARAVGALPADQG